MEERLQKLLSRHGVASRRQAEQMILEGRVRVNGSTAHLGDTADDAEDTVEIDGIPLRKEPPRLYIMLNKPRGYVTTMQDEQGRRNVAELVQSCGQRVYPVGRLDLYSEGLLLMTNDGEWANRLMHPRNSIRKRYHVWVSGFYPGAEARLSAPIVIDGRQTKPAQVLLLHKAENHTAMLEITISEGRNRQIRRLCQCAGLVVTRLRRVQEGSVCLGDLPVGQWRFLTPEELRLLRDEE